MSVLARLAAAIDRALDWLAPRAVRIIDTPPGQPTDTQRAQALVDRADAGRTTDPKGTTP